MWYAFRVELRCPAFPLCCLAWLVPVVSASRGWAFLSRAPCVARCVCHSVTVCVYSLSVGVAVPLLSLNSGLSCTPPLVLALVQLEVEGIKLVVLACCTTVTVAGCYGFALTETV